MPQFIPAAVMASMASAIGVTVGTMSLIVNGVILAGGLLLSSQQARAAKKKARAAFNDAQQDRLSNIVTTVGRRELVLGRVRKGGTVVFKGTTGANKTTNVMVIALAGHEIDAIEAVYLNDQLITIDAAGAINGTGGYADTEPYRMARTETAVEYAHAGTGAITLAHTPQPGTVKAFSVGGTGDEGGGGWTTEETITLVSGLSYTTAPGAQVVYQYTSTDPKARFWWYLGTAAQTADARLISLFPSLWTSAHRARGVAYAVCEFTYDETAFPSGLPTPTFVIRGAKCYDPRTATTIWSENPAVQMRHVLTHANFGKRTSITADEDARIVIAANACDTATIYTVGGVAQASRALYKSALTSEYERPAKDVLNDLAMAMAGEWAYASGQFYLRAGTYTAPSTALTDTDLAVEARDDTGAIDQRPIQITTHRPRDQQFNSVLPVIWDAAQDYKQTALTPLKSSALITRDGVELTRDLSLPAVGYAPQALHIAGVMLRDARDPVTLSAPFKMTAYRVELFDVVSLTIARYGWSTKAFIVIGREWMHDGHIRLTMKETDASIYTKDANFSAQGGALNTALTSPWDLPTMGALTVSSGPEEWGQSSDGHYISRVRVSWTALTDSSITRGNGQIEIAWIGVDGVWSSMLVAGYESQAFITGLTDGRIYGFRARCRNAVAQGDWSPFTAHQVALLPQGSVIGTLASFDELAGGIVGTVSNLAWVRPALGYELETTGVKNWGNVSSTWGGWSEWNDQTSTVVGVYTTAAHDFGATVTGQISATVDADGTAVLEMRSSTDGVTYSAWADYGTTFTGTHVQLRLTITPATNSVAAVRTMRWQVRGPLLSESVFDVAPASLSTTYRIGEGEMYLPTQHEYTYITRAEVIRIDDSDTGWTWELTGAFSIVGPNPVGPSFAFYLNGVLTDPDYVSFYIEGY